MERLHDGTNEMRENERHQQAKPTKKVSITAAAGMYVVALLLGGLIFLGNFLLPHSGPMMFASVLAGLAVVAVALYSVWSIVKTVQAQR